MSAHQRALSTVLLLASCWWCVNLLAFSRGLHAYHVPRDSWDHPTYQETPVMPITYNTVTCFRVCHASCRSLCVIPAPYPREHEPKRGSSSRMRLVFCNPPKGGCRENCIRRWSGELAKRLGAEWRLPCNTLRIEMDAQQFVPHFLWGHLSLQDIYIFCGVNIGCHVGFLFNLYHFNPAPF